MLRIRYKVLSFRRCGKQLGMCVRGGGLTVKLGFERNYTGMIAGVSII